jgi:hypothetical protein
LGSGCHQAGGATSKFLRMLGKSRVVDIRVEAARLAGSA